MLRLLAAVLLLFAVNLALAVVACAVGQTLPADVIAYVSRRTDDMDIYLLDSTRGLRLDLTPGPNTDTSPAWSPDGGRLAFVSDRDGSAALYVLTISGTGRRGLRRLVGLETGVYSGSDWSPDGTEIAYVSGGRLRIVDAEGGAPRPLAAGEVNGAPDWSPDGTQILFPTTGDQGPALFVWDLESGARRMILALPASILSSVWSPDGTQIAFVSTIAGNYDIFTVDSNGGNLRQVTYGSTNVTGEWLPDGRILFTSSRDGSDVYVMNADGGGVRRLTDSPGSDFSPSWRPYLPSG